MDDLREEFVRDFVFPLLRSNAVYEGRYLLGTSIARPLIAKRQIEIAEQEHADAVCHGATGKGNDQVRFELTYFALKPDFKIVAPWRDWTLKGSEELIDYAAKHKIPVTATKRLKARRRCRQCSRIGHGETTPPPVDDASQTHSPPAQGGFS